MWAKISTSATAMACAAGIATAATLPVMGPAEEQLAETASMKLSALSGMSASPLYEAFLGNPNATTSGALLDGVDAMSATSLYTDFLADPTETTLGALLAVVGASTFGAMPVYLNALSDPAALAGIRAFTAAPNHINVLTSGDLSGASGLSGIAAFNALPVHNAVLLNGDISALAPDQTPDAVGGIAALSAVPGHLGIDPPEVAPDIPNEAPMMAQARVAPESGSSSTTPTIGSSPLTSVAPVVEGAEVTPTPTDNSGPDSQNITRTSKKFAPESIGNSPILFGTGTSGVDNGMPRWQSGLKKLGLGGEESPSGATSAETSGMG